MPRILHCIPSLGMGGAERQLTLLSSLLPAFGWEVHVAVLTGGVFESRLDPATTVHRLKSRSSYDPLHTVRIVRLIRGLRPAIVQTWLAQMDVVAGAAALWCRARWIISERSSALAYPPGWRSALRTLLGRHATGIVANSSGGAEFWKPRINDRATLHAVIPNALDPAEVETTKEFDLSIARGKPLIVYVGRFSPEKRIPTLVAAMDLVRREIAAAALFCGDGPMKDEVHAQVEALGLRELVTIAGFVPHIPTVLRRADVFVSLSRFEGLPNTVQEAVMCRTPLVLSDVPAHRELVDEHCAIFVDGDDPRDVAAAIAMTLRDRQAARKRAENAALRAAAWSPAVVAAAYDAVYRQLLEVH